MVTVTINGTPREVMSKSEVKAVRNAGLIPCVLYGSGDENVHFTTTQSDVRHLVYTAEFKLAEVIVNGKSHRCILKGIQFDSIKDTITHIDFLQLTDGRKVIVEVPLSFEGVSPGVRAGGKFVQKTRRVKIKTTPENLVDKISVDISGMRLGHSLRIRDIAPVPGVEIVNPQALPIATIAIPRALKGTLVEEEEAA
jgi:large subunit ribosomal protein L25